MLSSELLKALCQLQQLPLTRILSAGTMPMFTFGELRTGPSPRGGTRENGTFELHIQCAWRIVHNSTVYMGSGDYYPDLDNSLREREWDEVIKARIDHLFATMSQDDLTANNVTVDEFGGFELFFNCGAVLGVFADASHESEYWRIFQPDDKKSHVVCESIDHSSILKFKRRPKSDEKK
jgi:hypothetical protein